jgi:hypothetical protein
MALLAARQACTGANEFAALRICQGAESRIARLHTVTRPD